MLSPEEHRAVQKDIEDGLRSAKQTLSNMIKAFPIALERMPPASTSKRKLLHAYNSLVEAHNEIDRALNIGIAVMK